MTRSLIRFLKIALMAVNKRGAGTRSDNVTQQYNSPGNGGLDQGGAAGRMKSRTMRDI